MSSLRYSPLLKKEEVCGTEKEALALNIVVKEEEEEEEEEEDVTVKEEEEPLRMKKENEGIEAVTVKEEEVEAFRIKKEEEEEVEAFRIKKEEEEAITLKEEKEPFGVKEEEEDISIKEEDILRVEEEEETRDLNTRERPDSPSDSGKSPSGEPDRETSKPAIQHHYCHCGMSFWWLGHLKDHKRGHTEKPYHCSQCEKGLAT
ncbi:cilia- and flagella-associated protein 251 isoform X3 [Salmo salar]|uniref:Cilia- and flagella-associated protein 251 isoform X3 n=1 Tax=Salmo salar TaxID=8030 RepID=A0ABM3CIX6_SALSA|nr:cilia- and flagella-associated protein 251 isoform X3 [Salmo salar]